MSKSFWNARYAENASVYGEKPNRFFKQFIDSHKPGSILLPAEGEGRNAIYAASKGWQVDAFDFSEVAREKALSRAQSHKLTLHYDIKDIESFKALKLYDAVALIYVHLPAALRTAFHRQISESLEPGGFMIFEAFAKEQEHYETGGPKDPALLYDAPTVCSDFPFMHILSCGQNEIDLDEGAFHKGKAAVLQMIGQKL